MGISVRTRFCKKSVVGPALLQNFTGAAQFLSVPVKALGNKNVTHY